MTRDMTKTNRLIRALCSALLCFSGCSSGGPPSPEPEPDSPGPERRPPEGVLSVIPAPVTLAPGLMRCVKASILEPSGDETELAPNALDIEVSDSLLLEVAEASECAPIVPNGIGLIGLGTGTGTATFSLADAPDISRARVPVEVLDVSIELLAPIISGLFVRQERMLDAPRFTLYNAEGAEISSGRWSLVRSRIHWESANPSILSVARDAEGRWMLRGVSRGTTTLTVTYPGPRGPSSVQTGPISVLDGELVGIEGVWASVDRGAKRDLALPSGPHGPSSFPPTAFEEGSCFALGLTARYWDSELMTTISVDYPGEDIRWDLDGVVSTDGGQYCAGCCGEALVTGCVGELCATGGFTVFPAGRWTSVELSLLRDGPIPMTQLRGHDPVFCAPLVVTARASDGMGVDVTNSPFVHWEGQYVDSEYPLHFVVRNDGMPCFSWDGSRHRDPVSVTLTGCYLDFDLCDSIGLSFVDAL